MWDVSWTDTNFILENATTQLTGYTGSISALVNYYTRSNVAGFLNDGRNFGYVQALPAVGDGVGEPIRRMGFVQPDNRLVGVGQSGKLYNGVDGTTGNLPVWSQVEGFNGVDAKIYDGIVAAKRHNELWVGSVTMYGVEYGAIFERKMGAQDYQVVWQNESDDIACSIAYNAIRNSFITLGRDRVTGELMGIYDSDLRSVSDYFASINQQLQTLTSIVNKAMYRGGARKGEVRAWTKPIADIPEGWALCDGRYNEEYGGNVPNLMGRFLRGFTSNDGPVLVTGGADNVTLTSGNLAQHAHDLKNHTHNITAQPHTHTMSHTHSYTGGAHSHGIGGSATVTIPSHDHTVGTLAVSGGGAHTHDFGGYEVNGLSGTERVQYLGDYGSAEYARYGLYGVRDAAGLTKMSRTGQASGGGGAITGRTGYSNQSSATVYFPQSTGSSTPGLQISGYTGSTGPATGIGTLTAPPSVNTTGDTGSGQPFSVVPANVSVFWIIATRDHAAAEGIDTSFLSAEQMMAILHATAPGPDNPFLTALDVQSFPSGPPGRSAYELAVDAGFQGTAQQWLDSLDGPAGDSAYITAVNNGFIGTQIEWLASLHGKDGADGDGKSAYTIAQENGFVGTEQEWIASLHGRGLPAGGTIGQVATKYAATDYAVQWQNPQNENEVQVWDHMPTIEEMATIDDDTLVMVGNTSPSDTPFGVGAMSYDIQARQLKITLTDGKVLSVTLPDCEMPSVEEPLGVPGLMSAADCQALMDVISAVQTLAAGGVWKGTFANMQTFTTDAGRLPYTAIPNSYLALTTDATQYQLLDFVFINNDETNGGKTTSYIYQQASDGTRYWTRRKDEVTTIALATNGTAGVVVGNASTDGQIRIEANGTMTVNGWTTTMNAKMDKPAVAVAGHLATFDANQNAIDSGSVVADFATATQGARADTAVQKPATFVSGNVAAFDGVGNVTDSGKAATTLAQKGWWPENTASGMIPIKNASGVLDDTGISIKALAKWTHYALPASTSLNTIPMISDVSQADGNLGVMMSSSGIQASRVAQWRSDIDKADPNIARHGEIVFYSRLTENGTIAATSDGGKNPTLSNIRDSLTYSTTETPTGETWVDGRVIYRKVIRGTSPDTSDSGLRMAGLTPAGSDVIEMTGILIDNAGSRVPLGYNSTSSFNAFQLYPSGDVTVIIHNTTGSFLSRPFHLIVRYVK
jgi:hypothetical protein